MDIAYAYTLKTLIGYGNIYKVKNKNAVILVIANKNGLLRVLNLINNKIRNQNKLIQINNLINNFKFDLHLTLNTSNDLNNHWLAGFTDADGSFQIKVINKTNRNKPEIRLNFQIDQKYRDLLDLIKSYIGGNIGYRSKTNCYYYGSTSFGSAKKVINYFDKYHLLSSKYINYLKWRKTYILIQNKKHLTEFGINKIINLKNSMSRKDTEIDHNNCDN